MKTLRELLMEKHQDAASRLNEMRSSLMAELSGTQAPATRCAPEVEESLGIGSRLWWGFWMEVILPCRRFGWGVLAVWVVVALLHQASMPSEATSDAPAIQRRRVPSDVLRLAREQRRELVTALEWMQAGAEEAMPAAPAQGPRSQRAWPGDVGRG